jgi:uncharacterized membrane protein YeaQ/YmgE (transglycosylase-associated protein family)
MGLIMSVIVGGIVGWIASIIMKTNAQMGLIANIIIGIVGSALGWWIAGLLGIAAGGWIVSMAISIAGAVLLIFILGKLGIFKR